jgi:phosphatidylinositol kinase/protein kinase (PI-3  family)
MMRKTGAMFHIDFGFIFGRDPKPFPPPMKFTKEMIMAMGGLQSPGYAEFRRYCGLAYSVFRKHASLILNLLSLMADAGALCVVCCVWAVRMQYACTHIRLHHPLAHPRTHSRIHSRTQASRASATRLSG